MEPLIKNPRLPPAKPMTECAQCGEMIFAASWSEYVSDRRVRHLWECDGCGYTFETEVRFRPALAG